MVTQLKGDKTCSGAPAILHVFLGCRHTPSSYYPRFTGVTFLVCLRAIENTITYYQPFEPKRTFLSLSLSSRRSAPVLLYSRAVVSGGAIASPLYSNTASTTHITPPRPLRHVKVTHSNSFGPPASASGTSVHPPTHPSFLYYLPGTRYSVDLTTDNVSLGGEQR